MSKHTPLPWATGPSGWRMTEEYNQPFGIYELGKPNLITGCFKDVKGGIEVTEANAAFIVRACNSHYELLEALKICRETIRDYHEYQHSGDPWEEDARAMGEMDIDYLKNDGRLQKIDAAIAKATGEA